MATSYNDIFVRDNFGDNGQIPSDGAACESPDIIPVLGGTLNWASANSTYSDGIDHGQNIVDHGLNNIYVRAFNKGSDGSGTVALYSSPNSLFLSPPWTPVTTAGGSDSVTFFGSTGSTIVAAGTVALSSQPFMIQALKPLPGDLHYCLISVVQTPSHAVAVPTSFASNAAFVDWVQMNPAVGWRNVGLVPNSSTEILITHGFGNDDSVSRYYIFKFTGMGFAAQTPISVQSADLRCPIQQSGVLPAPDSNGEQIYTFEQLVPAGPGFSSTITITLTSPGGDFPPVARLKVQLLQDVDPDDMLHLKVSRPVSLPSFRGVPLDGPIPLIKLGECTTVVAPNSTAASKRPALPSSRRRLR
ncbi:MAG TPA: hypothetical protein VGB04_02655 [Allosphingosinicella sp.]|jgi:hypothetical protein